MITVIPIEKRRGRHCELRLTDTSPGTYAVGLFPVGEDTGICVGVGASPLSAFGDALDTLQAARWAIDESILAIVRPDLLHKQSVRPGGA